MSGPQQTPELGPTPGSPTTPASRVQEAYRVVVAGIAIVATVVAFTFAYLAVIVILAVTDPLHEGELIAPSNIPWTDYVAGTRSLVAAAMALLFVFLAWALALQVYRDEKPQD